MVNMWSCWVRRQRQERLAWRQPRADACRRRCVQFAAAVAPFRGCRLSSPLGPPRLSSGTPAGVSWCFRGYMRRCLPLSGPEAAVEEHCNVVNRQPDGRGTRGAAAAVASAAAGSCQNASSCWRGAISLWWSTPREQRCETPHKQARTVCQNLGWRREQVRRASLPGWLQLRLLGCCGERWSALGCLTHGCAASLACHAAASLPCLPVHPSPEPLHEPLATLVSTTTQ